MLACYALSSIVASCFFFASSSACLFWFILFCLVSSLFCFLVFVLFWDLLPSCFGFECFSVFDFDWLFLFMRMFCLSSLAAFDHHFGSSI